MSKITNISEDNANKNNENKDNKRAKMVLGACLGCVAVGASLIIVNNKTYKTETIAQKVDAVKIFDNAYPKDIININNYKSESKVENQKNLKGAFPFKVLTGENQLHNNYKTNTIIKTDKDYKTINNFSVKKSNSNEEITLKDVFEVNNGDILAFSSIITAQNESKLLVSRYNNVGSLISEKQINGDVYNIYFDYANSQYIIVDNKSNISKYNLNGDNIYSVNLESSDSFIQDVSFRGSNLVILTCGKGQDGQNSNEIIEIDNKGNKTSNIKIENDKLISSVYPTSDKGYLVALQSEFNEDFTSDYQTQIAKISSDGSIKWSKAVNSMSDIEFFEEVEDGYLVVRKDTYIQKPKDVKAFYQTTLYSLSKYDKNGEIIWSKHLGDLSEDSNISAFSETQDVTIYKNELGIVITGFVSDKNGENTSAFKVVIDGDGNIK